MTAIVLLTRDLRVHDQPALAAAAASAERVVPLFVLDDGILDTRFAAPNRVGFLLQSLADLRERLPLVVRRGDVVAETARLAAEIGASALHLSADVSAYARRREERLRRELRAEVTAHGGVTIVPPGEVAPQGRDHYQVFTPYWRAWREVPRGDPLPAVRLAPHGVEPGGLPPLPDGRSPEVAAGGESAGRARLDAWLANGIGRYGEGMGETSRLSPYLHLGCLSAREVAARAEASGAPQAEGFVRQLCWRDFYAQLLAARPETATEDLRPRPGGWSEDDEALAAWREGRTGVPLVDAGMRQLAHEGWMHNRARLVAASFLTKQLALDWRAGARHFYDLLVDGDVAQNAGNWQWAAGTGVDTRPYRTFNPEAQARKLDPDGDYVRRWVDVEAADYPAPIVDQDGAVAAFRRRRGR